jgi:D-3-phosphoglycerate dehydrogenase
MTKLRTVVVGDALLPTPLISRALEPLDGLELAAEISWGPPDESEVDRMALRLERDGPQAEPPPEGLSERVSDAEALVVHYCPVAPALLDAAPRLRILATCRAGLENIAVDDAVERGILVLHVIGRTTEAVSDFAVGLLLAEARNIARAHRRLMEGQWDKVFPNSSFTPELEGKTVGIVGFGEIGRAVARKLAGFRVELLAHDPFVDEERVREDAEPWGPHGGGWRGVGPRRLAVEVRLRDAPRPSRAGRAAADRTGPAGPDEADRVPGEHGPSGAGGHAGAGRRP